MLVPQTAGGVQSVATVQVFTQAPPVQRPGAQLLTDGLTQVPVPLQVDGASRVDVVGQLAPAHWVPAAQRAHWPAAHWPVVPQLVAAVDAHMPWGSAPLATLLHVPSVPDRLHAWQAVLQAVAQHTPCAQ